MRSRPVQLRSGRLHGPAVTPPGPRGVQSACSYSPSALTTRSQCSSNLASCYELALTVDRQAPLDPQRYTGETLTRVSLVELISGSEGVFNASLVCTGRGLGIT